MTSHGGFENRGANVLVFESRDKAPFIKIVDVTKINQANRLVDGLLGNKKDGAGNPFLVTHPVNDDPYTIYVDGNFSTNKLAATSPFVIATAITGAMVQNGLMDPVNGVNMIRRTCSQAEITEDQLAEALRRGGYIRSPQQIAAGTAELPDANRVLNLLTDKEKPMATLQATEPVNVTLFETSGSAVQGMGVRTVNDRPVVEITADAHTPQNSIKPTAIVVHDHTNEVVAGLNANEQVKAAGDRLPTLRVTTDSATNRIFVEGFKDDDVGRVHAGAAAATLIEAYNKKDMLSTPSAMVGIQKLADAVLIVSNYEATAIGRLKPDTTIAPDQTKSLAEQVHAKIRPSR